MNYFLYNLCSNSIQNDSEEMYACTINVLRNNSPVCNVNVEEDTIYHIYSDKGESC